MRQKQLIPFEITGIDSLGQGVSKIGGSITFIPKTAIGDKGVAEILAQRKGVQFAKIESLNSISVDRIKPECVHFETCPSCHFQQLPYEQELKIKQENFEKLFRKLPLPVVEVLPAIRRFSYRNRIQLHYSLKSKLIGMRNSQTHHITIIPECIIALPAVKKELERLYENQTWLKEAPQDIAEGHVEIYWLEGEIKTSWNRPYAEGGFTQVFDEMNQELKSLLKREWSTPEKTKLLDLFAGNGNLSHDLNYSERLCVDIYSRPQGEEFISQDLYHPDALKNIQRELKKRQLHVDSLLLDPPRSGLKNLSEWISVINPRRLAYVSCDPHTLARDLASLTNYSIKQAFLIDFFPSTLHFESFIILERNS